MHGADFAGGLEAGFAEEGVGAGKGDVGPELDAAEGVAAGPEEGPIHEEAAGSGAAVGGVEVEAAEGEEAAGGVEGEGGMGAGDATGGIEGDNEFAPAGAVGVIDTEEVGIAGVEEDVLAVFAEDAADEVDDALEVDVGEGEKGEGGNRGEEEGRGGRRAGGKGAGLGMAAVAGNEIEDGEEGGNLCGGESGAMVKEAGGFGEEGGDAGAEGRESGGSAQEGQNRGEEAWFGREAVEGILEPGLLGGGGEAPGLMQEEGFDSGGEIGGGRVGVVDFVQVVFDLKGQADRTGKVLEGAILVRGEPGEEGSELEGGGKGVTGGFEEVGGEDRLLGDLRKGRGGVADFEGFPEPGVLGEAGKAQEEGGLVGGRSIGGGHGFEGQAEEDVPEDEGEVAGAVGRKGEVGLEQAVEGGSAPAGFPGVDQVVVGENEIVKNFQGGGEGKEAGGQGLRGAEGKSAEGGQGEEGSEAFAGAAEVIRKQRGHAWEAGNCAQAAEEAFDPGVVGGSQGGEVGGRVGGAHEGEIGRGMEAIEGDRKEPGRQAGEGLWVRGHEGGLAREGRMVQEKEDGATGAQGQGGQAQRVRKSAAQSLSGRNDGDG